MTGVILVIGRILAAGILRLLSIMLGEPKITPPLPRYTSYSDPLSRPAASKSISAPGEDITAADAGLRSGQALSRDTAGETTRTSTSQPKPYQRQIG